MPAYDPRANTYTHPPASIHHPAETSQDEHIHADTNQGPEAIHHTLGEGADQAAPGSHGHNLLPRVGTATPTPSASYVGVIFTIMAINGVADTTWICLKSSADTYSWVLLATG